MTTNQVNLPIVVGGVGAGVASAHLEAKKTVVGADIQGTVIIEASQDNVNWCQVAVLGENTRDAIFTVAAPWLRVNATGGSASSVLVMAEAGQIRFGTVPAPPGGGGAGAALDISAFGCLTTVYVDQVDDGASVNIEISSDGVDWSPDFKTFTATGCLTKDISARFIRAVGTNGTAVIGVASEEPSSRMLSAPTPTFVFRPGAPGGARGNVYTDWQSVYNALQATKGLGERILQIDSQHSPQNGTFLAFPTAFIPAGTWDMTQVTFIDQPAELGLPNFCFLEFAEGCELTADNDYFLFWARQRFLASFNAEVGNPVFADAQLHVMGVRVDFRSDNPNAIPMLRTPSEGLLTTAPGVFASIAGDAPVVDLAGGTFTYFAGGGYIGDGAMTDSVGGGTFGHVLSDDNAYGGGGALLNLSTYSFPDLDPTSIISWSVAHRDRMQFNGIIDDGDSPYQATFNEIVAVDSSNGPVQVDLPIASPVVGAPGSQVGAGERVAIVDVGPDGQGAADQNAITVAAQGTDTVGGQASKTLRKRGAVLKLVSDGFGNWMPVSDSVDLYSPPEKWNQQDVPASQAATALSALVSTNFNDVQVMRDGSVVGLNVRLTQALTGGSITVTLTINGAPANLSVTVEDPDQSGRAVQLPGVDGIAPGDVLGLEASTSDAGDPEGAFEPAGVGQSVEAWIDCVAA